MSPLRPRPRRLAILAGAALAATACFEPPVSERLEIRFLPGNAAAVSIIVRISNPDSFKESRPARERIEKTRRDLREASDEWSRRFGSLSPVRERIVWDLDEGELSQLTHRGILEKAESLGSFFSDTMIQARFTAGAEEAELTLSPGHGSRATRQQREEYRRALDPWLSSLATYFRTGRDLYDYLERNPDRAEACFGSLFRDLLDDRGTSRRAELSPEEEAVTEPFHESLQEALNLFKVPEDAAYSLEELSRLVNDPFPAPLRVRIPGPILEREGFEEKGAGWLGVSGLSLWEAVLDLQERWISPNPLVIEYQQLAGGKPDFDLAQFLRRPRSAAPPPTAEEIRRAIDERLIAAPVYRARWSTKELKELEEIETPDRLWSHPALNE